LTHQAMLYSHLSRTLTKKSWRIGKAPYFILAKKILLLTYP